MANKRGRCERENLMQSLTFCWKVSPIAVLITLYTFSLVPYVLMTSLMQSGPEHVANAVDSASPSISSSIQGKPYGQTQRVGLVQVTWH